MIKNKNAFLLKRIRILIVSIVLFLLVFLFSSLFMHQSILYSVETKNIEGSYKLYTNRLLSSTDYLSSQAYKYVVTGDEEYYRNYMQELNVNKTRENSAKELFALGLTPDEEKIISEALVLSNYIVSAETSAFNLMQLDKPEEAQKLLLNNDYEQLREDITSQYTMLIDGISTRAIEHSQYSFKVAQISFYVNICIVIAMMCFSILIILSMMKPNVDQLTGFENGKKYKDKIKKLINSDPSKLGALIYCDLDNLKLINDHYGYNEGDNFILEFANQLRTFEQLKTVIARLSSGEFIIYVHGYSNLDDLKVTIDASLNDIKNRYYTTATNKRVKLKFSAGVSFYNIDSSHVEDLIKFSFYTLSLMKKYSKGENGYYLKDTFDSHTFSLEHINYLDEIFEKELLDFAMQPIVDANTFEIFAYEALMRPQNKVVNSPFLLLKLAKSQSRFDKLERLVIKKVLEKVNNNLDKLENTYIFMNSIADQFLTKEELDNYENQYPGLLKKFIVEITEQEYVGEDLMKTKIDLFREYCSGIALDDYGAGYSNEFTLLSGLYDIVKIDMNLVRDIDIDPKRQEIIKSIIKVAKYANYKVLAEGVETENEVRILRQFGVDYFQGFYFAKPDLEIKQLSDEILEELKKM